MDGQDRCYGACHPSIVHFSLLIVMLCSIPLPAITYKYSDEGFPAFGVPYRLETMVDSSRLEREIRSRSLAPGDVPRVLVAAEAGKTWILDFLHRPHVQDGEMGGFAPQTRDLSALSSWAIFRRKFLPRWLFRSRSGPSTAVANRRGSEWVVRYSSRGVAERRGRGKKGQRRGRRIEEKRWPLLIRR